MCTVSWVPGSEGYALFFNRDERRTRAPAVPPRERMAGGTRYLAPVDGDFGGTWLAVNEFGLSLGLLNLYGVPGYVPPAEPVSRGHVIVELIPHHSARDALHALEAKSLELVQPFSLVAVEPGPIVHLAAWDGRGLTSLTHRTPGLVLTSSALSEPEVAAARRATFAALHPVTSEGLAALHRSHLPERGRRGICMHREDAETQSFTAISVSPHEIVLRHVPDAPCRGRELPPERLRRQPLPHPASR